MNPTEHPGNNLRPWQFITQYVESLILVEMKLERSLFIYLLLFIFFFFKNKLMSMV